MRRYFIYLSYDGARYHGWQVQPNGCSVQETLMKALSLLLGRDTEVVGAGRTDAGVNASMMVAHFDCLDAVDTVALASRLNRMMPQDIAIQKIVEVRADAHARFSALSRTYHYYVSAERNPFCRHYCFRCPQTLDFALMNKVAERLFDYRDFTSFSKLHTDVKTNNCRIMKAEWVRMDAACVGMDNTWVFVIQADRFLRNMVRAVVGTLIDVGRGRMTEEEFCSIIEAKDRCRAGMSVPGQALFLADIEYPADCFL